MSRSKSAPLRGMVLDRLLYGGGRLHRIALAKRQHHLVGLPKLARLIELVARAERQRADGGNQDRVVVESAPMIFHQFDSQVDEAAHFLGLGVAEVRHHESREAIRV